MSNPKSSISLSPPTFSPKSHCDHCGNEFRNLVIEARIGDGIKHFCCEGCETVYSLIHSLHAENFYSLKGGQTIPPARFAGDTSFPEERPEVLEKFVRSKDGISEVFIQITNIHCSACVWLNEKVLQNLDGVVTAQINFASGRAKVSFASDKVSLRQILDTIRSIGYRPVLYLPGEKSKEGKKHLETLFLQIVVAGFSFGNIMLFSVGLYTGFFTGIDLELKRLFHYVSWALATPAYLYSGAPFFKGFFHSLRKRTLSMDFLLFVGISIAYFYSIFVTLSDQGEVYFDSVAMIYFFILIGKFFEEKARVRAQEQMEHLLCKLPENTILLDGPEETSIPSQDLKKGNRIKVLAGVRVPVDGILETTSIQLDESFLTGESRPITKIQGDRILAGSLPLDSYLSLVAESDYHSSTLSSLRLRLEEALLTKPKIQLLTERIASRFITVVFGLAILTFFGWYFLDPAQIERALLNTISVLIVACPCALGISVPTALVVNHILNAKKGVLLKNPGVVEALSSVQEIFLDKTGTLTEGKFSVRKCSIPESYLPMLLLLERQVNHPIAKSIVRYLEERTAVAKNSLEITSLKMHAGQGVEAVFSDRVHDRDIPVILGNAGFLEANGIACRASGEGTEVHFASQGVCIGSLVLQDEIREEAKPFLAQLKETIPEITILSGDQEGPVQSLAESLGVSSYQALCKPEEKKRIVVEAMNQGKVVAMVGDGINDSIALASANIGISHSEAEDLSLEKSDVILASGNLLGILYAIRSAKVTRRVIFQNILISFCYNSIMLPLAIFGYMLPVLCAVFMASSSITVLLNSISLRWRSR